MKNHIKALLIASIIFQTLGALLYFIILKNPTIIQITYAATKIAMLLIPIAMLKIGLNLPKFSLKPNLNKSIFLGITSGTAISAAMLIIFTIFNTYLSQFTGNILEVAKSLNVTNHYIMSALAMSLAHSIFEEYYWRWYTTKGLETITTPKKALLIASLFFAAHHYIILYRFFPLHITILFGTAVGIGGAIWTIINRKTNSMLGPWISHAIIDATIFYIGYQLIM